VIQRVDVLQLFNRQFGVARVQQLRDLGVSWNSIARAKAKGAITEVLPQVVRLAGARATFEQMVMAAQLQASPDGFVSGLTAAAIRGIPGLARTPIHITVPRRPPGQRSHSHQRTPLPSWIDRSESNWHDEDLVEMLGPCRVERADSMLFTIGAELKAFPFERIAEKAWHLKIVDPPRMRTYLEDYRRRGRAGVRRVEEWLNKLGGRTRAMQSNFETDILHAVRRVGLPEPSKQHLVMLPGGIPRHLDLAWAHIKLALEPGHTISHHGELAVVRDAELDHLCGEIGWYVMRFTEEARRNLAAVASAIKTVYRARSAAA
jgi:hypothetical protein